MKTFFNAIFAAFSTFSVLPAPKIDWEKYNLRGILCALPLVGAVIGLVCCAFAWLVKRFQLPEILLFCGLTAIPVLLSGGIHMDGFADTIDALSSHADKEKKREILKDPRSGAFAITGVCLYFLLYFGLISAVPLTENAILLVALTHVLSRALGSFTSTVVPAAHEGMLKSFTDTATVKTIVITLLWIVMTLVGCAFLSWKTAALFALTLICTYLYVRHIALHEFGGMSGDIAGYCITLSELLLVLSLVISERMFV